MWSTIVDRTAPTNRCRSWQEISFNPTIQARYLRLTGTYNSNNGGANNGFHVVEWEVYGAPLAVTYTITPVAGTNGSIVPGVSVILEAGQSTSLNFHGTELS